MDCLEKGQQTVENFDTTRVQKMSLRTLPILFFNLGGEMIYILDQRLKAQSVTLSKSQKGEKLPWLSPSPSLPRHTKPVQLAILLLHAVVQDIVGQMFEPKCVKELFRPQKVLSMHSLRVIFSKLAHSSIMKLHESAMDKVGSVV